MGFRDLVDGALKSIRTTLGETISYTPGGGEAVEIKGVFSDDFLELDPATGVPVQTKRPNVLIRLADLEAEPEQGDELTARDEDYVVHEVQKDGEGGALLLLHKA